MVETETGTPKSTATGLPTGTETLTETPQPSETPSQTAEMTGTPEVTATPEPTEDGHRAGCDLGNWEHPEGKRLSTRWGTDYKEIMTWFCQGYGFGEIDLAYELAHDCDRPVGDVFQMRASGEGWGQIKADLSAQSGSTHDQQGGDSNNIPGQGNEQGQNNDPSQGGKNSGNDPGHGNSGHDNNGNGNHGDNGHGQGNGHGNGGGGHP